MTVNRKTVQPQHYTDSPPSYCCGLLEDAVENLGYIQYEATEKTYTFVGADGSALLILSYCPFCAAHIPSLGPLMNERYIDYVVRERSLTDEEFDRYWPIISQDLGVEETMRLIDEERLKKTGKN